MAGNKIQPLGIELVKRGIVTEEDIGRALDYQKAEPKKKIGDILILRASPKNRKFVSNINEIIFNKICSINPFLKEFFELSYLDMFNNYYIKEEREMDVEGYHVKLSQRTKIFNDLIEKNQASSMKLREIAEQFFINKKKNVNPIFVIEKNNNNI